jgi:hypothetical protein
MRDLREIKAAAGQTIKERDFWKRRLAGEPVKSSIPYDYFYPGTSSHSRTIERIMGHFTRLMQNALSDLEF